MPEIPSLPAGLVLITGLAVLHSLHVGRGSKLHNLLTVAKAGLIVTFILGGLIYGDSSRLTARRKKLSAKPLRSPMFAVELVYVSFAYSGWNTAAYMAGEFRQPARDIPRAVLAGTAIVTVVYLGLNVVFLASARCRSWQTRKTSAHIAAVALFGDRGGQLMTFTIMAGLVSTASSNIMAGPRVFEAHGPRFSSDEDPCGTAHGGRPGRSHRGAVRTGGDDDAHFQLCNADEIRGLDPGIICRGDRPGSDRPAPTRTGSAPPLSDMGLSRDSAFVFGGSKRG